MIKKDDYIVKLCEARSDFTICLFVLSGAKIGGVHFVIEAANKNSLIFKRRLTIINAGLQNDCKMNAK